jgi:hypothetical protein
MKFHKDMTLPQNGEIFVFGSNLAGYHKLGSARIALLHYGAIKGKGVGRMGNSFAIPTKNNALNTLPLFKIKDFIRIFKDYVIYNPEMNFFVTRIGCGYAGYKDEDIAPMFKGIYADYPEEWRKYLD